MTDLETLILRGIESKKRLYDSVYKSLQFDYNQAVKNYADSLGIDVLSIEDKQQAVLDAVLKEHDDRQ